MKLFITGATGFLGRHVVRQATSRGHDVLALIRNEDALGDVDTSAGSVRAVLGDLRRRGSWRTELAAADAVIHLAAAKGGDFYSQFAGTVIATENLLAAMVDAGVDRLVHVSTFSVYDYTSLPSGGALDEHSPIEPEPERRDGYTRTKLLQETLVREYECDHHAKVTVVRPGAVYGGDALWDGGLGQVLGPIWLAPGDGVTAKFTYVENCAEAIVLAAERDEAIGATLNIVDDDPPVQRHYADELRRHGVRVPRALPVPYSTLRAVVGVIDAANRRFLDGRARLPTMLVPALLDARFKPYRCPNDAAKRVLGWVPRYRLREAVDRAVQP